MAAGAASLAYLGGSIIFASPVQYVILTYGFRMGYFVMGSISVVLLGLCALAHPKPDSKEDTEEGHEEHHENHDFITGRKAFLAAVYVSYAASAMNYYFVEAEVMPIFKSALPTDSSVLVFGVPMCLLCNGSFRLIWGILSATRSASRSMGLAAAILAVTLNLWAIARGSAAAELLCAMISFSTACSMWPLMPVMLARNFSADVVGEVYALINTADVVASCLGAPATSALASVMGWPYTLHTVSVVPAVVCLLMCKAIPEDKHDE